MQLLTNNGDAALSSYFHYFVHQGFGSFGELVPFKDSNWTIPHYLLGSSYNFNELLNTFMATVQALWQENSERSFLAPYLESPMPYWWDPQMLFSPLLFHLTLKLTRLLEGLMVLILCPQVCCQFRYCRLITKQEFLSALNTKEQISARSYFCGVESGVVFVFWVQISH